jgi:uncharacterized protein (DUF4415 family)
MGRQEYLFSGLSGINRGRARKMRPKHPEYFKPVKKAIQIHLGADVLAWFKGCDKGYQGRINAVLREVMLRTTQGQA